MLINDSESFCVLRFLSIILIYLFESLVEEDTNFNVI